MTQAVVSESNDTTLRITEIFLSLQGEANTVGCPTVFVRLTGCPLRCQYCDSAYAFSGGEVMALPQILQTVASYKVDKVTVTGGEPLAQPGVYTLMTALADQGFSVSLETSGALPVEKVDSRIVKVLDVKTPDSAEVHRNLWENFEHLQPHDQIKFVLCSRGDYDWARAQCDLRQLYDRAADVLFSPSHSQLEPRQLADWIVQDRLPVRMQVQLHKLLWGDVPGR
ncbi:MAG: 7-carboxy-7-deazaguanine synthase QueE [Proteobacteria bacterium]|nr:7-carboxy-7-deazaguanine synthase QueE [Pseudomonadota bacterium]